MAKNQNRKPAPTAGAKANPAAPPQVDRAGDQQGDAAIGGTGGAETEQPKNPQPAANGTGITGNDAAQDQAGQSSAKESGKSVKNIAGLEVSSTVDGYRRGGRSWTKEPQVIARSELTEEQIALLEWDSHIRVIEVEIPQARPSKP